MTTADFLTQLYQVQCMDLELDRLKDSESRVPEDLSHLRIQLEDLNEAISECLEKLEVLRKGTTKNEAELEDYQAKLTRAREEQEKNAFDVRIQTQYENLIQQLQDRIVDIEEVLEPLYEEREGVTQRKTELTAQHRDLRPRLDQLETSNDLRLKTLQEERSLKKRTRDDLVSSLVTRDRRQITEYEMIRKAKHDAVVSVQQERCSGCNMQLPTLVLQKVASGKMPASRCPSCGRILVRL